uniref:Uncharacterized protein n=1 Tax=Strigamia maritima TaxID=126957 RepID=T1J9B0_STRMM
MAENQIKLAKTPWGGILVGYAKGLRGYRIWKPTTDEFCFKKIFSSTFQKTQQRDSPIEAMKTTLFLSVCATLLVYSMQEEEWNYVDGTLKDATKELQALATIALGVQEHVYQEVLGHATAKAAWENLAKIYQNTSFRSQVALLTELINQLNDMDLKLDDKIMAAILLASLPAEFKPMIMAIESCTTVIKTEAVKVRLLQEAQKRESEESSAALHAGKHRDRNYCGNSGTGNSNENLLEKRLLYAWIKGKLNFDTATYEKRDEINIGEKVTPASEEIETEGEVDIAQENVVMDVIEGNILDNLVGSDGDSSDDEVGVAASEGRPKRNCGPPSYLCDFVAKINIFVKKIIENFVTDKSLHAVYIGCAKAFILGDSKDCNAKKFKMPQVKECEIAIKYCDLVAEINIFVKKIIENFVTDKSLHAVYIGCAKAFILGDSKDCNAKKFKMPQVKECEIAIKYPELKHKLEKHNLHIYKERIENALYSNDMDYEEICTKFNEDGDKVLAKIKKLQDATPGKDPATCKKLQEFITEGLNPESKKLAYKLANQEQLTGSKNGYRQVFEIMTGGGPSFGIPAATCIDKIIINIT